MVKRSLDHESSSTAERHAGSAAAWWAHLLWVPAAAILGFAVPALFAGWLRLPRDLYLVAMHVAAALWGPSSVIQLPPHS